MGQFIDINCDMGEGMENDEAIMPLISSANIACGYHAGDEKTALRTIEWVAKYNVAVGAHPSYPDRENFGRTDMQLPLPEVYELVKTQVQMIQHLSRQVGISLHHVKPHGALYNAAAKSESLAATIARAVKDIDENLILYGLSNSLLITEAKKIDLQTASEVFADRTYDDSGNLTPRSQPGALLQNKDHVCDQVLLMAQCKKVISFSGQIVPVQADTVCIHGDGNHAFDFAKAIHSILKENGIDIKAI